MGKEKEMLKTILANTELIMAHLKIGKTSKPAGTAAPTKAPAKKATTKTPARKTTRK